MEEEENLNIFINFSYFINFLFTLLHYYFTYMTILVQLIS